MTIPSCRRFDVIATTIMSLSVLLCALFEMTRTGRLFTDDKSLKGTGIRTISPRLYIIPDLIVFVVPETKRTFARLY